MTDAINQPQTEAWEALLSEIASTAFLAEEMLQESIWDSPEASACMSRMLRQTIARMGWMADIGLHRLGSSNCMHGGDAVQWMMPPYAIKKLGSDEGGRHG